MADGIIINKADGDNIKKANEARADFQHALHLFSLPESGWNPRVLTASALEKRGIAETWQLISEYVASTQANGYFQTQRQQQDIEWFRESMKQLFIHQLMENNSVREQIKKMESKILNKEILPSAAAAEIIRASFS